MNRKLKKPIAYTSITACIGSDEYYLEKHGFICKVALKCDPDQAKYFEAMHKMHSEEQLQMIIGKLEDKFDELVEAFKNRSLNC